MSAPSTPIPHSTSLSYDLSFLLEDGADGTEPRRKRESLVLPEPVLVPVRQPAKQPASRGSRLMFPSRSPNVPVWGMPMHKRVVAKVRSLVRAASSRGSPMPHGSYLQQPTRPREQRRHLERWLLTPLFISVVIAAHPLLEAVEESSYVARVTEGRFKGVWMVWIYCLGAILIHLVLLSGLYSLLWILRVSPDWFRQRRGLQLSVRGASVDVGGQPRSLPPIARKRLQDGEAAAEREAKALLREMALKRAKNRFAELAATAGRRKFVAPPVLFAAAPGATGPGSRASGSRPGSRSASRDTSLKGVMIGHGYGGVGGDGIAESFRSASGCPRVPLGRASSSGALASDPASTSPPRVRKLSASPVLRRTPVLAQQQSALEYESDAVPLGIMRLMHDPSVTKAPGAYLARGRNMTTHQFTRQLSRTRYSNNYDTPWHQYEY
ncbi:hypothetical protein T492DRAFT_835232 [Pavlovales sp. CCMP2436]|nr:hypothetical protein T492DRAFT_835232 [Pavlovales sp. CCMP2436]